MYGGVDVDLSVRDVSQILVVWLVLVGDEDELEALQKLYSIERGHAQIQHQAVQDRKGEELKGIVRHHRNTNQDGHEEKSDTLFPVYQY